VVANLTTDAPSPSSPLPPATGTALAITSYRDDVQVFELVTDRNGTALCAGAAFPPPSPPRPPLSPPPLRASLRACPCLQIGATPVPAWPFDDPALLDFGPTWVSPAGTGGRDLDAHDLIIELGGARVHPSALYMQRHPTATGVYNLRWRSDPPAARLPLAVNFGVGRLVSAHNHSVPFLAETVWLHDCSPPAIRSSTLVPLDGFRCRNATVCSLSARRILGAGAQPYRSGACPPVRPAHVYRGGRRGHRGDVSDGRRSQCNGRRRE
jgi:hypothetical protein